jgi:hypothetical protein
MFEIQYIYVQVSLGPGCVCMCKKIVGLQLMNLLNNNPKLNINNAKKREKFLNICALFIFYLWDLSFLKYIICSFFK